MRNANVLKGAKRLTAVLLALVMLLGLVPQAFAAGQARSTETQTSSPEETVYVNSYGGSTREVDFCDHWRFNRGSGSAATNFDDSQWRDVDLPHDYSIEQAYSASNEAESGYLPGGTGWYRKTFTLPPEWEGKYITIDFGGVYMNATVYLNGKKLGFHPYGYTAFSFELPQDLLDFNGDNVIAVKVEHNIPSSRWYSGSGIYRTVHLTVTDPVHVAKDGVYVTTPKLASTDGADGTMNIETVVENTSAEAVDVTVRQTVYQQGAEQSSASVTTTEATSVQPGSMAEITQTAKINNPALWSTDAPNLYTLVTEVLVDGNVVDRCETEFGFRWTTFNNTIGFALNGEPTKLKGVCMHHDQGPLGSEAWYRAIERQIEILKEMGCNAIRVTHNPAAPELIEIANEKGIMLIDEAFDTWVMPKNGNVNDYSAWFEKTIGSDNAILGGEPGMTWAEFDIKAMANQDKNSPAVIMYSLGNEIFEGTANDRANEYPGIARNLCTWLQEVDNTRPPTFGQNSNNDAVAFQVADVLIEYGGISGVNYAGTGRFDTWVNHDLLVYYSETASAVNSRGVYDRKASNGDGGKGDYLLTSYDKSKVGWGAVASDAWKRTLDRDNSMGEFVWTGFDYIGEPTPWNGTGTGKPKNATTWPAPKSSYFGIIDTNGLPKDSYYFYQSQWNDDVYTLHILPTWNEDEVIFGSNHDVEVVVYSDAPVIKLYLKGDEVGTATSTEQKTPGGNYSYRTWTSGTGTFSQKSGHESLYATFWVPYAEGKLEVKAFQSDGTTPITGTTGRSYVETTTAATQLTLEADRSTITADGDDLSYITISVKDAEGRLVNTDDVSVNLSITGEGEIIGVDNGRQPDHTSYQSLTRNTGAGQLVAVVQSTDDAGSFTVTATADGLTSGSVKVTTTAPADGGQVEEDAIVSYQISRNHYVKLGSTPELPETVTVTYRNGQTATKKIDWNSYDSALIEKVGSFSVTGTIEGTTTTVSVSITMLDTVAALLNYSAAVQVGANVTLPASRPAILADGTILNAEFPVTWDEIPADLTAEAGTKTIKGTSTVFGQEIDVTASIRVAEGNVTIGANVAPSAAELTQDIPQASQSDTLEAIRNGSNVPDPNLSGGPNPAQWSNFDYAQDGATTSALTFRYDTAQYLGQVVIHYNTDSYSAALPSAVKMEVSGNGTEWTELSITAGEETVSHNSVHTIPYTFAPVDAVFFRVTFTNKPGDPPSKATAYCVAVTELELKVAQTSFPIYSTADLTGLTVNGKEVDANSLANHSYSTEALVLASLTVSTNANVAYTILPAYKNVVRILTESENHSARSSYAIYLDSETVLSPEDGSRDYDYAKTTASAPSFQPATSGNEGPIDFAVDNNEQTYWHTKWGEYLENSPDKRYIQLTLEKAAMLDALRYKPRPTVANGIVTEYRVEVSMDGSDWETVAEGTWTHDTAWKIAEFTEPVEAKYVRLYGVQTRGGAGDVANRFMSCAELRVRVAKTTTDLSSAKVTVEPDVWHYTGEAITPDPVVTLDGKTLRKGVDYKVSYIDNTDVGEATVTVTGILDYSGQATGTFAIKQAWTVTFLDGTQVLDTQVVTDGQAVAEPETAPVKDGYTFTGWYTDAGCETAYDFASLVSGNLTLYAGWEQVVVPVTEWTVTFLDGSEVYTQTKVEDGKAVAEPETAPVKDGYTFTGWYTDAGCETVYDFASLVSDNLTLYAGWEQVVVPVTEWTVTFLDGSEVYAQAKVEDGKVVAKPDAPVKDGYTFTGWYTDAGCETAYDFASLVSGNLTLYAGWEQAVVPVTEWTVTFLDGSEVYAQTKVEDGKAVTKPDAPVKDGYTFTGWYTDAGCETAYDFASLVSGNLTLYAGWEQAVVPVTEWTVTFMSNGAVYQTVTVEDGQSVSKPSNPTRPGYTFTGWYLDNACTIPYRFDAAVTGDLTLYAGWKRNTTEHKPVAPVDPIQPVEPSVPTFTDVKPTDWYSEAVAYTVEAGLMNGTGSGKFSPQATTTRGMLMTVLARMDGVDTTGGADWYTKGMEWAKREGVSDGTNPELPITREQLAAMLYRYAGSPAVGSYTPNFRDADQVSDWALDAMRWAVKNGVVSGKGNQTLDPTGYATRAEVAQMLYNFSKVI